MKFKVPEVGQYLTGYGKLVAVDPGPPPPPPPVDYIFETVGARSEMRRLDRVLASFGSFWEHSGEGTAVKSAIAEAKQYCKDNGIGQTSEVEIVVVRTTERTRMRPNPHGTNYRAKEYYDFAAAQFGSKAGMSEFDREEDVWTSRAPAIPDGEG